jgi:N-acetylmuramoyl-L-alanine amidase CwlA
MIKKIAFSCVAGVLALGYYWTPYIALQQLKSGLEEGHYEKVARHIDMTKIRGSIEKTIIKQNKGAEIPEMQKKMITAMVSKMLTEENLKRFLEHQKVKNEELTQKKIKKEQMKDFDVKTNYTGWSTFNVQVKSKKQKNLAPVTLTLERDGLLNWKVTGFALND